MMDKKLMFIGLILAVFISGCTQQQGTTQTDQSTTQTLPPELTNDGGLNDALSDLDSNTVNSHSQHRGDDFSRI